MQITRITQQKRDASRYSIYIDNVYSFSLSENALLQSKIYSGQSITAQDLQSFKSLSDDDKLKAGALQYVANRSRSEREVQRYLAKRGASEQLAESLIEHFKTIGLLDDAAYAQNFVHDQHIRPGMSARQITAKLTERGVAKDTIAGSLEASDHDDEVAARRLVAKLMRQARYAEDTQKMTAYLLRRGFSYDVAKKVIADQPNFD